MKPTIIKRLKVLMLSMMMVPAVFAMDFNAGTYYFDNSKVKFSSVRFVAGDTTSCSTIVFEMTPVDGKDWWEFTLSEKLSGIDHFTFIDSELAADTLMQTPKFFVDSLASIMGDSFKSTILYGFEREVYGNHYDSHNYPSWVFCPLYNSPNTNGYWRPIDSYDGTPSGTVPIIHINTQDSLDISSKEDYIAGTFWLDNCGIEDYDTMASELEPLDLEIRGRGNYSWFYSYKKPYKIKFAKKQTPLGLSKSKHFVLMPKNLDYSGYLRNETGFELSRQLEMPFTTKELPVELILNGEYMGLYFLCEHIRVEKGRVDIVEQNDNETDPEKITGGWLLENRAVSNIIHSQYENNDPTKAWLSFEPHSPEVFSAEQKNYISSFISKTDSCIYVQDKEDMGWEQYIDMNSLARFYIIHEVVENVESFNGSLYMYKDRGDSTKLHFGPVWDFDSNFYNAKHGSLTTCDNFIYNYDSGFTSMWIEEISKFSRFQQKLREVWKEFKDKRILEKTFAHAHDWRNLIEEAEQHDLKRWRTYASSHTPSAPQEYLNLMARKVRWLNTQWGENLPGDVNADGRVNVSDVTALVNMILRIEPTNFDTADVNGDRRVNTSDLTALINIILGIQ